MKAVQPALFGEERNLPNGMQYREEIISAGEEQALAAFIAALPLRPFEFVGGFQGNRRVMSFGWRYDFIPEFRARAPLRAGALRGADHFPRHLLVRRPLATAAGWAR